MPYCAWCGQEVANVSTAPCPHCGRPINGAQFPPSPAAGGDGSRTVLIVVGVVVGGLFILAIVGILAAIAIPNLLTATQRAKQKRTMADLRTIATALEARATDKNEYPNVQNFSDLRPFVEPEYVKTMPQLDGWGNPFRYACPQEDQGRCTGYVLGSGGKDGRFESDDLRQAVQSPPGPMKNFDCDIIYGNGKFLEYPDGMGGM